MPGILLLIFAVEILFVTHGVYLYGNDFDWTVQHVEFPSYMRQLFYSTGKFFPDFAMNLGGGQNIYYIAYYGLFSPIVLFSYLLPFVPMLAYMTGAAIVMTALSIILIWRWLSMHLSGWAAFAGALLFTLAAPVMYHSHHHLMFVNFLPFMILAMEGIEKYVREKKCLQLILSVFLIIICSYFFSVGAVVCLCLYWVYRYLKQENVGKCLKDFIGEALRLIVVLIIPVLMSAVLWLPVLHVILAGRADTTVSISLRQLLLPQIQADSFFYKTSGMGLTAVFLFCISGCLAGKGGAKRFAGIIFLALLFFGLPVYVLNGGMYINGKVLISFLPFAALLFGGFLEDTMQQNYLLRRFLACSGIIAVAAILTWHGSSGRRVTFILDLAVSLVLLLLLYKREGTRRVFSIEKEADWEGFAGEKTDREGTVRKNVENRGHFSEANAWKDGATQDSFPAAEWKRGKKFLIILLLLPMLFNCFEVNGYDSLLPADENPRALYGKDASALMQKAETSMERSGAIARTDLFYDRSATTNYVLCPGQLRSGIYSSLNNQRYRHYYFLEAGNEISGRSNAVIRPAANPLFEWRMGVRYIIGFRDEVPVAGYSRCVAEKGHLALYENRNALPLGYTSPEGDFHPLVTTLSPAFIEEKLLSIKGVHRLKKAAMPEKAGVRNPGSQTGHGAGSLKIHLKKAKKTRIYIQPSSEARILQITMHVRNRNSRKGSYGSISKNTVRISVNNENNVLAPSYYRYGNGNHVFHFTLFVKPGVDHLTLGLSHGKYTVSHIRVKAWPYQQYLKWRKTVSSWYVRRKSDNILTGKIKAEKDGNMRISIPYDEGFTAVVDGKKTGCGETSDGFLFIPLKKGSHQVTLAFHAPWKREGMAVSALGILLLAAEEVCMQRIRKRKKMEAIK